MPKLHSYVVARDYGFAPNPFYGFCTLATCKPKIRKTAQVGDWVIGTGSKTRGREGHIVYAMRVSVKKRARSILLIEYMQQVEPTDRLPLNDLQPVLLGLFGEVGSIMATSKKLHREQNAYAGYLLTFLSVLHSSPHRCAVGRCPPNPRSTPCRRFATATIFGN